MSSSNGGKGVTLPSEDVVRLARTIKRPRDQCRVVVTLECQCPPELMKKSPTWARDATDILRGLVAEYKKGTAVIPEGAAISLQDFLRRAGVNILVEEPRVVK
jgi:hypothetical protein